MGYRSDVRAVFYSTEKTQLPMLKLFIDENFPEDLKGGIEPIESGRYFGFQMIHESIKWYESYPEIVAFNNFVEAFKDSSPEYEEVERDEEGRPIGKPTKEDYWCYEFIRVGENYDDIETDRSWNADGILYVNRSIHIDA
jgi:hypothetical protein